MYYRLARFAFSDPGRVRIQFQRHLSLLSQANNWLLPVVGLTVFLEKDLRYYKNYSGAGNTLICIQPVVRDYILDCLRHWVMEMHVDGFRFDLASVMARDEGGNLFGQSPVLERIAEDPILWGVKLIAEAWDAAGVSQVGVWFVRKQRRSNGRLSEYPACNRLFRTPAVPRRGSNRRLPAKKTDGLQCVRSVYVRALSSPDVAVRWFFKTLFPPRRPRMHIGRAPQGGFEVPGIGQELTVEKGRKIPLGNSRRGMDWRMK